MAKRPLKILHLLVTMPVGGAEDLVAAMVTGMDPARFQVQAATIGPPGAVARELTAAGHPVASLGLDVKRTPFFRVVAAVRRLLKEMRPDILHTHLYHPNLYGRLAALGLGLRGVVAVVHNTYTRVKLHRRVANFLLSWATDRVLAVSPQVWRDVRRYDGVPASRLLLVPNGVNLKALNTPMNREQARAALGVAGFCLGAVGRLEEQKGHIYLLDAVHRLQGEIPSLTVLVAGEGRLRQALEARARDLEIAGMVRFLGTRRDLPVLLRALDVYVQPSLWEGLSLALLQAMGAGLPVVGTEVEGIRQVVQDGVNGRLVPSGDGAALAQTLRDLYRRPEEWPRLGDAARRTVWEGYSQEAMLARLAALYLELAQQGRHRGAGA